MPGRINRRAAALMLPLAALAAVATVPHVARAASSAFAVGIPTVVDPIRGVGEPDIVLDNSGNAIIDGPGGSGAQTSFFWHSRDGGLTYPQLGPANGHWICAASGGGDSLGVIDRKTNDLYLTDQEALADIGSAKIAGSGGALTQNCATAPGATADRPFEGVLDSTTAPQNVADGNKPILYLSWLCSACTGVGTGGPTAGGLAFGWSDDGIHFHAADPGVVGDFTPSNTLQEAGAINSFGFHGNTVTDPATGYVYTPISCSGSTAGSPSGCPFVGTTTIAPTDNEVGVVIGAPQPTPSPSNIGQFSSLTYQPAVTNMTQPNSLFPVMGIDSTGTLYEAYIEGDGFATATDPLPADAWHLYYTYSLGTDGPLHTHWSTPVQVDAGPQTATSDFGWMSVGDPGKLGFVWLGTDAREHPSLKDTTNIKQWHAFMAITTTGLTATPTFQQSQVGIGPNHINDMCLQGTVGCVTGVGNRNMADFISTDIDPVTGALQATWANDSNQLATQASTMIPGLPLTETARQVSGPQLIGSGNVSDSNFSTTPASGINDATGDGLFPVQGGTNTAQLDLTHSGISGDGVNLVVDIQAASLSSLASPDTLNQHVWWLTTWQFNHKIYFARAESDLGGAIACAAGAPASFDRPGLNLQTIATLVDYSGGTTVACTKTGNDISITVPPGLVGSPGGGAILESVTGFTALDNGAPLAVGPGGGNIPAITDATPAYDALVTSLPASTPEVPLVPLLIVVGVVAAVLLLRRQRRSHDRSLEA